LLLGPVAHGIAWWAIENVNDPATDGELRLAPLADAIDPTIRALLESQAITVPAADERRFFGEYFPALHERVTIAADPDVTIPEPEPPVLALRLEYAEDERLELTWQWRYVLGEAVRIEPLWLTATSRRRDSEAETVIVKTVEEVLGELPGVVAAADDGGRLKAAAWLGGIEAMRFVSDVLPRLAELSGLEIETIGTPRTYREATAGPVVAMQASAPTGDRDWLDLAVTVTVDGEEVPFDRLFVALASGERHLVLPSGTWFSLERPELATLAGLIAEARALNDRGPETARVGRFQADLWEELDRLGVITGQAAEWQASMRALSQVEAVADTPVPDTITAALRPYQATGFSWLAFLHQYGLGGVLADEMGLGKTLQAIALIAHTKQRGEHRPFLVVAPTSVVYNWSSECERFAPTLDVRIVTETGKRRPNSIAEVATGADVVVTSYALFRLEYDAYAGVKWAGLILDEAQFVKNAKSRAYRCAKLLPAPFKLAITGTPMENNLSELWSLLSITAPGLFPHPAGFDKHYRAPIEKGDDRERLAQLRRRVKPLMLRRTKEQVVDDLPAKQEQVVELPLNAKHRRVYETHLHRERQKVLGLLGNLEKHRFEIFRSLTLLRQASLDPVLIDPRYEGVPSTKLDALMELLTEIASEGHRTLVFSQFTRFLGNARQRLDEAAMAYCYLDGSTRHRPEVIERFRTTNVPVFLISLKAGGFGLNLTEADYCVLLDPWWNPATEAQAVDRIHRIGQTRNVMVYRLVAKDTIEDKVMALKARKAALFDSVMSDGEVAPGALTAADIRGILE
jgi:superfamily II DNA or RNA helicase